MQKKYFQTKEFIPDSIYTFVFYTTHYFCKFVKTTEKGYNFLNLNTNQIMFKNNFYPLKNRRNTFPLYQHFSVYNGFYCKNDKHDKLYRKIKLEQLYKIN